MKYLVGAPNAIDGKVELPFSKSIFNRYLILCRLCDHKLPDFSNKWPEDVKIVHSLLSSTNKELNVNDAGTAMRFLAALLSVSNGEYSLKGSDRMHNRPIKPLVDGLQSLGANITYLDKVGFPPLLIKGKKLKGGKISLPVDISSQFLSAILMIAPLLEEGAKIEGIGKIVSAPYIDLTLKMMKNFGVNVVEQKGSFAIGKQEYKFKDIFIEKDWSSAAFMYQIVALSDAGKILLAGLNFDSFQGDKRCKEVFALLGVESSESEGGVELRRSELLDDSIQLEIDFIDIPDLVQSVVMTCLALKINLKLSGLYNLHLKESNRLEALKYNIEVLGGTFLVDGNDAELIPAKQFKKKAELKVFNDHRMAMALAPLAVKIDGIMVPEIETVIKSFPGYWKELTQLGFSLTEMP